jgi:lysophospholipase L1-like esterase
VASSLGSPAVEGPLVDGFEAVGDWRPLDGRPTPELAIGPGGHSGRALQVRFFESSRPSVVGRPVAATAAWDQAPGVSFWIKGDGSSGFVAVCLLDESLTQRHVALVSLADKSWRQVRLRWEDFVPESLGTGWFGAPGPAAKPSGVRAVWLGRWLYLRPWSAAAFELDEFRLEPDLGRPAPPAGPARQGEAAASPAGLAATLEKLRRAAPVTMLVLGDSVTFGTRLGNPAEQAWPALLQSLLRTRFGCPQVTVLNRAEENLETRHAIILLPRVLAGLRPDLVLVQLGYNDFAALRERRVPPAAGREVAARNWRELVQRLRAATEGRTEVLLIGTIPDADSQHRSDLASLAETARAAAAELGCGYCDAPRAAFLKALAAQRPEELFTRLPDGRLDIAHPNAAGHRLFAEALATAFETPRGGEGQPGVP